MVRDAVQLETALLATVDKCPVTRQELVQLGRWNIPLLLQDTLLFVVMHRVRARPAALPSCAACI